MNLLAAQIQQSSATYWQQPHKLCHREILPQRTLGTQLCKVYYRTIIRGLTHTLYILFALVLNIVANRAQKALTETIHVLYVGVGTVRYDRHKGNFACSVVHTVCMFTMH